MDYKGLHNEDAILARIAAGDELAFGRLLDHYTPVIYPYLTYWLKNSALAQEVSQDIFVRIWNNRHKLQEINNLSGYIYTIARNRAYSVLSAELNRANVPVDLETDTMHQSASSIELKELESAIASAIETLPPKRKEVFKLSRQDNMSYDEIAEKLQISRNTVKGHIVSALVYLRTSLKSYTEVILLLFSINL